MRNFGSQDDEAASACRPAGAPGGSKETADPLLALDTPSEQPEDICSLHGRVNGDSQELPGSGPREQSHAHTTQGGAMHEPWEQSRVQATKPHMSHRSRPSMSTGAVTSKSQKTKP